MQIVYALNFSLPASPLLWFAHAMLAGGVCR